jgi:hypothetical protein
MKKYRKKLHDTLKEEIDLNRSKSIDSYMFDESLNDSDLEKLFSPNKIINYNVT